MKILAIYNGGYPYGYAMSKRLHLYCKGLVEHAHEVKVVLPLKTETSKKCLNTQTKGQFESVYFEHLSKSTMRSTNFLTRKLDDLTSYFKLLNYLIKNKADVFVVVDIRNNFRFLILLIAYLKKVKVVYEINEHPQLLISCALGVKIGFWIETTLLYPLFDGFIVISEALNELVDKYKGKKAKIIKIPILIDLQKSISTKPFNTNNPFIFHSGSLSEPKDGIIGMLEGYALAVKKLNKTIDFLFTGSLDSNPNKEKINSIIKENGIKDHVKFLGYISEEELNTYLSNCALLIINKHSNLQNTFCFPTKLGEYLSFSKPIIMTSVGELSYYFKDGENAYVVSPGDPTLIANKIIDIFNNPEKSNEIGNKGRKTAEAEFNYKIHIKRLSKFFENLSI